MTKRQKLWLVWDENGNFVCARHIERIAKEEKPEGGSVTFGYKPKPDTLAQNVSPNS